MDELGGGPEASGKRWLMANLEAHFYNWWHFYVRLYDGKDHREAITSRPEPLKGVRTRKKSAALSIIPGNSGAGYGMMILLRMA